KAAALMARTLRGEVRPTQALAMPPVAISIDRQCTSEEPCLALYALAKEIAGEPGALSSSVNLGFPYADVAELGTSFIVVTDNNPAQAREAADRLARYLVDHRHDFACKLEGVEASLDAALAGPFPVCLLDVGDNIGGGAPGDGT